MTTDTLATTTISVRLHAGDPARPGVFTHMWNGVVDVADHDDVEAHCDAVARAVEAEFWVSLDHEWGRPDEQAVAYAAARGGAMRLGDAMSFTATDGTERWYVLRGTASTLPHLHRHDPWADCPTR